MDAVTIGISGMSCAHCVSAVQKALAALPGVVVHDVKVGSASVSIDPAAGSMSSVEHAIDEAGFDVVKGRVLNVAPAGTPDPTSGA